jgi:hypothetical protein
MCFLPNGGVAEVRERPPKAGIAADFRRRGCAPGRAFRAAGGQGEPPQGGSPTKGGKLGSPTKGGKLGSPTKGGKLGSPTRSGKLGSPTTLWW